MAVPCSETFATRVGQDARPMRWRALVPAAGWHTMSCGDGSKGPGFYDWALISTISGSHHLLARRSLTPDAKGELELAVLHLPCPGRDHAGRAGAWSAPVLVLASWSRLDAPGAGHAPARPAWSRPGHGR